MSTHADTNRHVDIGEHRGKLIPEHEQGHVEPRLRDAGLEIGELAAMPEREGKRGNLDPIVDLGAIGEQFVILATPKDGQPRVRPAGARGRQHWKTHHRIAQKSRDDKENPLWMSRQGLELVNGPRARVEAAVPLGRQPLSGGVLQTIQGQRDPPRLLRSSATALRFVNPSSAGGSRGASTSPTSQRRRPAPSRR